MKKLSTLVLLSAFALAGCVVESSSVTTTSQATTTSVTPTTTTSSSVTPTTTSSSSVVVETPAQGVTQTTITVANCAATSGFFASVGDPFNKAIQAYFNMVNAAGGVDGRTIEFLHEDDQFNASLGLACVQSMVEDEEVFALVGHFGTPTVGATLNYIKEMGIPTTYLATGISQLYFEHASEFDRPVFPVQPIYNMEGRIMVARAKGNLNLKKLAILYTADDAGLSMLDGIRKEATTQGIALSLHQFSGATDAAGAVAAALAVTGVDGIIVAANQAPFLTSVTALVNAGNTLPVITSYVSAALSTTTAVKDLINPPSDDPDKGDQFKVYASAWVDIAARPGAYTTFATEVSKIDAALAANAYAMAGWIAADLFVEGLRRLDEQNLVPTWKNYMDVLEGAIYENPFGGDINFANGQRLGTQEMSFLVLDPSQALGWNVAPNGALASIEEIIALAQPQA